jgi:hypothetical protein
VSEALAVRDPAGPPAPPYPAGLEITYPSELGRWLPLVKWLLAIPLRAPVWILRRPVHATVAARRLRLPAWNVQVVLPRARLLSRDDRCLPTFSLADDPNHPVRASIDYPEHVATWRPLVQWLLAIPYLLVAAVLYWLTGVLTIVAFFTVLFTKRIPREIFELMTPGLRWNVRGNAYGY